ncbi:MULTISPECIES: Dak phosphatase [unclassified Rothia (in: high G+C Gram-positive bacteria)]|uniref:Dak phosphatase n=1 Tax=unclassified Rothia (in: high G+C Gram-positive bacteria) TaxID=2689056 RepID=UPI0008A4820D|nr:MULTISPECIES: Dak phosphatase [unclassified Rothia (in: high G+C Gram-positive bacteria)]OFR29380.1 Dak phosphatase [Rothia sp. HMSC066G02]
MNAEQNQRTEEREIYRRACVRAYRFGVAWSTAARTTIERYREALNELNGFPVPDKDTGSNIAHTLLTLTEEFERGMEQILPNRDLPSGEEAYAPEAESVESPEEESLAHLWVQLGDIYEHAIMRASRVARGNSGTLLCAWALEAVRSYWFLPGNLAQELGEAAAELPLVRALEADYERVLAGGSQPKHREVKLEYAHAEARAMAFAAERIRASVGEQMVPSTMLSVMVELARLDAHYDASQDAEVADEALKERRRALMLAALERTADFPPSPELAGFVDAGALGFYLAVVHSNPRWEGATLNEAQVESMLRAPSAAGSVARAASAAGSEPAERAESEGESGWELMGTLTCEPLALAQLRPELEAMGDSLLITPLDMAAGLWALHVHVPEIEPARALIMGYGQWADERISSLADGHHADHACGAEGGA